MMDQYPKVQCEPRLAACVRNPEGHLLMYTVQSTMAKVEEYQKENNPLWEDWKRIGCHIVQIKVDLYDCYWTRKNALEATNVLTF